MEIVSTDLQAERRDLLGGLSRNGDDRKVSGVSLLADLRDGAVRILPTGAEGSAETGVAHSRGRMANLGAPATVRIVRLSAEENSAVSPAGSEEDRGAQIDAGAMIQDPALAPGTGGTGVTAEAGWRTTGTTRTPGLRRTMADRWEDGAPAGTPETETGRAAPRGLSPGARPQTVRFSAGDAQPGALTPPSRVCFTERRLTNPAESVARDSTSPSSARELQNHLRELQRLPLLHHHQLAQTNFGGSRS